MSCSRGCALRKGSGGDGDAALGGRVTGGTARLSHSRDTISDTHSLEQETVIWLMVSPGSVHSKRLHGSTFMVKETEWQRNSVHGVQEEEHRTVPERKWWETTHSPQVHTSSPRRHTRKCVPAAPGGSPAQQLALYPPHHRQSRQRPKHRAPRQTEGGREQKRGDHGGAEILSRIWGRRGASTSEWWHRPTGKGGVTTCL